MTTDSSMHWLPSRWVLLTLLLGSMLCLALALAAPVNADDFVVNSTLDTPDNNPGDGVCDDGAGNCTLRSAIEESNVVTMTADTISFAMPGAGLHTIHLQSSLPPISSTMTIDAITQPGAACATAYLPAKLLVEIDGSATISPTNGLALGIGTSGSTIRGLVINRFPGSGIFINGSNDNVVVCNHVGVNAAGTADLGNTFYGINLQNSANNLIGGDLPADRNVVSGNGLHGIYVLTGEPEEAGRVPDEDPPPGGGPSINNRIAGNYIGANASGVVDLGNSLSGVAIEGPGSDNNMVDGRNLIAGNDGNGVALLEGALANTVADNLIGVNITGRWPLANSLQGVLIENAAGCVVQGNLISGNLGNGVQIADPPSSIASTGNQIAGNVIGLNILGDKPLPNGGAGVFIQNASSNTVGGAATAQRNVISGNSGDGVLIQRSPNFTAMNNAVRGNYIGTDPGGSDNGGQNNLGNGGTGVSMFNAQNSLVDSNVIGANAAGVNISGPFAAGNVVTRNFIGVDATETIVFGNGEHGVFIDSRAHDNRIGGAAIEGNVIAKHSGRGLWMTAVGTDGNAIRRNSIYENQGTETENKLGIDLSPSGPNPNDPGDIDNGPNLSQNYPTIIGVYELAGQVLVNGLLMSAPNTTFELDFFANTVCDASGFGEGETYLETIVLSTDDDGLSGFSLTLAAGLPVGQDFVTATATDPDNNTSELSNCVQRAPALVVTSSDDADDSVCNLAHCSLREAIYAANAQPGADDIVFAIPGAGPHKIQPLAALPAVTSPVNLDATTQPLATCPLAVDLPPIEPIQYPMPLPVMTEETEPPPDLPFVLQVEIDGSLAGSGVSGLTIDASDSSVRGLAINSFDGHGLVIENGSGNHISCNYIGFGVLGTEALGNGGDGIHVVNSESNLIGADVNNPPANPYSSHLASQRNVVGNNQGHGVQIAGPASTGNQVFGNFVGVDVTGNVGAGNLEHGIYADRSPLLQVGAMLTDTHNIVAGNGMNGIHIESQNTYVTGNYVGVDANATTPIPNLGDGVAVDDGVNNTVESNLVSGNGGNGVFVSDDSAGTSVTANFIGTDVWLVSPLGNGGHGVAIEGHETTVDGNGIVFNGASGVAVVGTSAVNNLISDNVMFANTVLGIDLGADGVTANDPGDADDGPNHLQNYPLLTSVDLGPLSTVISGTLDTTPGVYAVAVYGNAACHPSEHGEGMIPLATMNVTVGVVPASFTVTIPGTLTDLTFATTATDAQSNTSEFSKCLALACDVNHDFVIDMVDVQSVAGAWGQNPAPPAYDLVPDGVIDVLDIIAAAHCWLYATQ